MYNFVHLLYVANWRLNCKKYFRDSWAIPLAIRIPSFSLLVRPRNCFVNLTTPSCLSALDNTCSTQTWGWFHRNLIGIEFPCKAFLYNGQRPHLYYGGENLKYYLTPPLQISLLAGRR
jgi:hypothetical protein